MADERDAFQYEHGRRTLPSFKTPGFAWFGARTLKPLIGGFVGFGFVATFLAVRGGNASLFDELTGQTTGGWSRHEDVHLLIVVNAAIVAGLAVQFLAEYTRHWLEVWLLAMFAAMFLGISQASNDIGGTAEDVLLGLAIGFGALTVGVMAADAVRYRHRAGY